VKEKPRFGRLFGTKAENWGVWLGCLSLRSPCLPIEEMSFDFFSFFNILPMCGFPIECCFVSESKNGLASCWECIKNRWTIGPCAWLSSAFEHADFLRPKVDDDATTFLTKEVTEMAE
jgi:hypothetical protein